MSSQDGYARRRRIRGLLWRWLLCVAWCVVVCCGVSLTRLTCLAGLVAVHSLTMSESPTGWSASSIIIFLVIITGLYVPDVPGGPGVPDVPCVPGGPGVVAANLTRP